MKYCILFLYMFSVGVICASAQSPAPSPTPKSTRVKMSNPVGRDSNATFDQLRALEVRRTRESSVGNPLDEIKQRLYRKTNKEEVQILAPAPYLLEKYAAFLRQPDAGIIKLNGDSGCVESPEIIVAKENCLQYTMPGAGTAYSFRVESHRLPRLADLMLSKDVLKTDGVLQQGIMVNLGDVPLEDINLQARGLKYLLDFTPAANAASLLETDRQLSKGIKADGFIYRLGFYAKDQTTFALRSIAYKGKFMRSVKGLAYNELDFDKRKDIVVAFRLIEKDANGNITILWKLLANRNAPTLKNEQAQGK